jgi:DNA-binding MarR family transcriptional regulator
VRAGTGTYGPRGPPHYGILTAIAHEGSSAQRDLGEKLAIDRSTMVGLIDELEGLGLVDSRREPQDSRRYGLTLTADCSKTVSEAESVVEGVEDCVPAAPPGAAQRRLLHEMLTSVLYGTPTKATGSGIRKRIRNPKTAGVSKAEANPRLLIGP